MPTSYGTGFTSGAGGWTGSHVPLPQGTVAHRPTGRPKSIVSPIVVTGPEPVVELSPKIRTAKPRGRHGLSIPVEKVDEIVRLYRDAGLSIADVASTVGASFTTVKKYLHSAGVEIRPRGNRRLPDETKTCLVCGVEFRRRDTEKSQPWRRRVTCGRRCGGVLAQQKHRAARAAS